MNVDMRKITDNLRIARKGFAESIMVWDSSDRPMTHIREPEPVGGGTWREAYARDVAGLIAMAKTLNGMCLSDSAERIRAASADRVGEAGTPVELLDTTPTPEERAQIEGMYAWTRESASTRGPKMLASASVPPGVVNPDGTLKPHQYVPDYQAMGDCRECGNVAEASIHIRASVPPGASPGPAWIPVTQPPSVEDEWVQIYGTVRNPVADSDESITRVRVGSYHHNEYSAERGADPHFWVDARGKRLNAIAWKPLSDPPAPETPAAQPESPR